MADEKRDDLQAAREDYERRVAEAANPSGDIATPDVGVTRLPDETAEESSVQAANDSIRGKLRGEKDQAAEQQSGTTEQAGPAETAEQPAARRPSAVRRHAADDEQ